MLNKPQASVLSDNSGISIVDVAKVFVRQQRAFATAFLVALACCGGLGVWYYKHVTGTEKLFDYSTILIVGYKEPGGLIEPVDTVRAQLQLSYFPAVADEFLDNRGRRLDFRLGYADDGNISARAANVIRIVTSARIEEEEKVRQLHERVVQPLLARHVEIQEEMRRQAIAAYKALRNRDRDADPNFFLVPSSVITRANRSENQDYLSWTAITGLSLALSLMVACLTIIALEFIAAVRGSLQRDERT